MGVHRFWQSLMDGQTAISRLDWPEDCPLSVKVGGAVPDFSPHEMIPNRLKPSRMSRQTQFALSAAIEAVADAGGDPCLRRADKPVLVAMGSSTSNVETIRRSVMSVAKGGPQRAHPGMVPACPPGATTGSLCDWLASLSIETRGMTYSSACAAGMDAIGHAFESIRDGNCDIALAGGCDAPLSVCPMAEFEAAGLANTETDPRFASRPFDITRQTGVLAEGAAVVIVETLERAMARDARIYAEVQAFEHAMDRDRNRPGEGLEVTISRAIAKGLGGEGLPDWICAWGPGHPIIDREEASALLRVFGGDLRHIPASSIKGVIGNPLAAAGALQVVASCLAIAESSVPPTANLRFPDPDCALDHVIGHPRRRIVRKVLCNAHGIGGGNSSILVKTP
jgi:3-oxoacyl-(acyl-carrier-protein) synthase